MKKQNQRVNMSALGHKDPITSNASRRAHQNVNVRSGPVSREVGFKHSSIAPPRIAVRMQLDLAPSDIRPGDIHRRRPRALAYEERVLLYRYCWEHHVPSAQTVRGDFTRTSLRQTFWGTRLISARTATRSDREEPHPITPYALT